MSKSFWISFLAVAMLVSTGMAHGKGRVRRNDNNPANSNNPYNPNNPNNANQKNQNPNSNSNQPTTQPFGSGSSNQTIDDDRKQLEKDKAALADAQKDLKEVAAKLKSDSANSPEHQATVKELRDAQAQYSTERARVLTALQNNPTYKTALADREQSAAQLASNTLADSDRAALAAHRLQAGSTITELETSAIANDPKASEAQRKVTELEAKSTAQTAHLDASIQSDPKWTAANNAIEKYKAAVAADEKKLKDDQVKARQPKDPNAI